MNRLFMSLVSLSSKTRQKADLEIQSDYLQSPFARDAFISLLYGAHYRGASHLLVYDDTADGISGPYDNDGELE